MFTAKMTEVPKDQTFRIRVVELDKYPHLMAKIDKNTKTGSWPWSGRIDQGAKFIIGGTKM